MSALRIARPGYPVILLDQGPSHANMSGYGGSAIQARPTTTSHHKKPDTRTGAHSAKARGEALLQRPRHRKFGDDRVRKNPDNGAVEAPITEVHP